MKEPVYSLADYEKIHEKYTDMDAEEKDKLENELKPKREVCFTLAHNTFRLLSSCKTAHDIWNHLKELYFGDDDQLHSFQTLLLSGFHYFK